MTLDLPPLQKLWLPPKPAIIRAWKREELKLGSFLPGMFPGGAAVARLTQLSILATGSATTNPVTVSASVEAGDLMIVAGFVDGAGASIPTGFSVASLSTNTATQKSGLTYKIAVGGEGTSVPGFFDTGGPGINRVAVFRGNKPITSVTVGSPGAQATDGNPTPQLVAASGGTPPLIVIAYYGSNTAVDPRTMSPAKDAEIGATLDWLAYKIYNTAPADVTVDMDDEGTGNLLASCYLACS
jgi:hypothetical protein